MTRLKTMTVVGTRPEIIRLSRLIPKMDQITDHVLVHTGQNFSRELNEVFFEDLELRTPDINLEVSTGSAALVTGETIVKMEKVLLEHRPDALLILGDTNSSLAAITAERMQVPVYHMEAGNRSFDANVPEELNRRIVDHVASFNLPYNEHSRRNLLAEGLNPRFILKTGSPLPEVLHHFESKISQSNILNELELEPGRYIVVSVHRQENVDRIERLTEIVQTLNAVAERYDCPVIVSLHPRTRKRLSSLTHDHDSRVVMHHPFGFLDYQKLQKESLCVMSDSGTIAEESAILGFRAITLRDSIERPEALEAGSIVLSGLEARDVLASVDWAISRGAHYPPEGYSGETFSDVVSAFVLSTARKSREWANLRTLSHT